MAAIQTYKPTTGARRGMTTADYSAITDKKARKSLLLSKKRGSGRNNQGKVTIRHRGGGTKHHYRIVSFKLHEELQATVEAIEYDPNRSAHIARIKDLNDNYYYILAGNKMRVGQTVEFGPKAAIEEHNRLPFEKIPVGSTVYNVELTQGKGGQLVRSAGARAQLMAKEGMYAHLRLPSGEVRLVHLQCKATIGSVGNDQHQNIKLGSAGRKRRLGWRPQVRGKAMNAVDHPHGGGDGGAHGVGRDPKTPWGKKTLGFKTRSRKHKNTDKLILRSRHTLKRK